MTTLSRPRSPRSGPADQLWTEARSGMRAMAPLAVGYVPFALLVGGAVAASADPLAAWAATPTVYGGSPQLALLQALRDGAGPAVAVAVAVLLNARLLVYGMALAPLWAGTSVRTRLLVAASVIDPAWMLAERRAGRPGSPAERRAYYAGAAGLLALVWIAAVTAGTLLGRAGSLAAGLAPALPLCVLALVVPHVRLPGGLAAVLAAAGTAAGTRELPAGWPLVLSMTAAAAAGLAATSRRRPC